MPTVRAKRAFAKSEALEEKRVAIYKAKRAIEDRIGIGEEAKELIFGSVKNTKSADQRQREELLSPFSAEWLAVFKDEVHEKRKRWRELYLSVQDEKVRRELIEKTCDEEEVTLEMLRATVDAYKIEREELRRPSAARAMTIALFGVAVVVFGQIAGGLPGALVAVCIAFVAYQYSSGIDSFERNRLLDKNADALKSAQENYERILSYGSTFSFADAHIRPMRNS